jgi:hypothetical protein
VTAGSIFNYRRSDRDADLGCLRTIVGRTFEKADQRIKN